MRDYGILKITNSAGMRVERVFRRVEERRRPKAVHISRVERRVVPTIINTKTVFAKSQLRDSDGVKLEIAKVGSTVARYAFPVAVEDQGALQSESERLPFSKANCSSLVSWIRKFERIKAARLRAKSV